MLTPLLYCYLGGVCLSLGWLLLHLRGSKNVLPNHRSSHATPTLQGGGISIAVVAVVALLLLPDSHASKHVTVALVLATATGWLDDFREMSGRFKLLLICLAVLPLFIGFSDNLLINVFAHSFSINFWLFVPVLFIGSVWLVNLTNFMDGINGLATLQAMFVLGFVYCYHDDFNLSTGTTNWVACTFVACLAFLPFNFPNAKMFLGDTGSLFLGVLMTWVLLQCSIGNANGLWTFLTLFAMFWLDATLTLLRRLWRRKSIFEAHREHAYQHLANERWQSHSRATLFVMLVNIVWLLPMAVVVLHSSYPLVWMLLALAPVLAYCLLLKAGKIYNANKTAN